MSPARVRTEHGQPAGHGRLRRRGRSRIEDCRKGATRCAPGRPTKVSASTRRSLFAQQRAWRSSLRAPAQPANFPGRSDVAVPPRVWSRPAEAHSRSSDGIWPRRGVGVEPGCPCKVSGWGQLTDRTAIGQLPATWSRACPEKLRRAHRLSRSRAGLAADRTRRHGRRRHYGAMAAVMVAMPRGSRAKGAPSRSIDLPLLDPAVFFYRHRSRDLPADGAKSASAPAAARRRQPIVFQRRRTAPKDGLRYIGISASIQAMAERLFRAIGHFDDMIMTRSFPHQQRPGEERGGLRGADAARIHLSVPVAGRLDRILGQPLDLALHDQHDRRLYRRARAWPRTWRSSSAPKVTAAPGFPTSTSCMADPHVLAREDPLKMSTCPTPRIGRSADAQHHPRAVPGTQAGGCAGPAPALGEHTAEEMHRRARPRPLRRSSWAFARGDIVWSPRRNAP